jgi:hypothetical protein
MAVSSMLAVTKTPRKRNEISCSLFEEAVEISVLSQSSKSEL